MTTLNHVLGFPRIGVNRELKRGQEAYWSGSISEQELLFIGSKLRRKHWKEQKKFGIDILPVGDFAWYDHVLTTSLLLGNIPDRHNDNKKVNLDTLFRIARGRSFRGNLVPASEMKKWFNTNYHYIVPEFTKNQKFSFTWSQLVEEVDEALSLGYQVKPVILGPLTYLWLGKIKGESFNRLDLLNSILPVYEVILDKLIARGIRWVQFDEPILVLDLEDNWKKAYSYVYSFFKSNIKILLTTYFDSIHDNVHFIKKLPIHGLHVDIINGKYNLSTLDNQINNNWLLSLGVINGRNIWKADLFNLFNKIKPLLNTRKNVWIGSSCSFLHIPIDLNMETELDKEVKNCFSFALQKCMELSLLKNALNTNETDLLVKWSKPIHDRIYSNKVHDEIVQNRLLTVTSTDYARNSKYFIRSDIQHAQLNLPVLPTTTIGSFPQTEELRKIRSDFKNNKINLQEYNVEIKNNIKKVIKLQEKLGLDVLVHGESERNDMVEYFGENLNGFAFTNYGWVQSYGSRCVKPPIIISDISRFKPITVNWTKYAQSLTNKPVKGMLTGPVTILCWSFPREDVSRENMSKQIALALRDEVKDLEDVGIKVIQIDEPALREGLPLREKFWNEYLSWAVSSFHLCSSIVKDATQIHTHMCYCECSDIMDSIIALDVDVITIETARSNLEILNLFKKVNYLNEIGPGMYDIHSPNIPSVQDIELFLNKAINIIPLKQLWVNPDCGLKTRGWEEIKTSLNNMVQAAKNLRKKNKVI